MAVKIGDRVRVELCTDPYSPVERGTEGTVTLVDAMGTVHVDWDNGRTLGLVPGEDLFTILRNA
jgi:Domain of unknown function (DUF4314)